MESSVKRKINVFGKVAKIITTVLIVVLLVIEGFLLTGGVIAAMIPKDSVTVDAQVSGDISVDTGYFGLDENQFFVKAGDTKIVIGDFGKDDLDVKSKDGSMRINVGTGERHFDLNDVLLMIVFGFLFIAAIVVALFFFKALMKQFMICDTPFCEGVVQKMQNFAIALLPCVAVIECVKKLMSGVITNNVTFDIDLMNVGFVIIIFVLAMVFKYGAELQKEHDETV